MSQIYPELLFKRVRDHLERAAAIPPNDLDGDPIRRNLEEAIECAYRPRSEPPLRLLKADMLL